MNRTAALLIGLLAGSGVLNALDWGVKVTEFPLVMTGQTSLGYSGTQAKLWFTSPLLGMDFRLETLGALSASSSDLYATNQNLVSSVTLDVSEASLAGLSAWDGGLGGIFEWSLGRRTVTDLTGGWIVNSRWDGASVSGQIGSAKIGLATGYSGLLLNATGRVAGSPADVADQRNTSLVLGPKRLFGSLWVGLNEAFWRQDIQTEILGDWDFRPGDQAVHGAYMTVALTGPFAGGFRHRLFGTGSMRISPSSANPGFLAGGELSANDSFLGSRVVLGAVAAWAREGVGFQPLSGDGLAEVVSLPSTHGASVKVDYSIRPLSHVLVGIKANSLWRTSKEPAVLSGIREDSHDAWLGTEGGFYGSWNPTSDFSLGWSGGVFLPQSGAFESNTQVTGLAAVSVGLKL